MIAQRHVDAAIRRVIADASGYWFRNDHALLILDSYDQQRAVAAVRAIAGQVRAIPLDAAGEDRKRISISVSAAIKLVAYRDLHYMEGEGDATLRTRLQAIVDDLRKQTRHGTPNTLQVLTPEGWTAL
jgi:hypothetical protein